ncbi:MAG: hypothetical protein E6J86_15045 [Deltaproteobacteria bacterium]|nr:MAG: hypothetical protein E6J86_15045 [Deltaproteobacteria bacterium]
MIISLRWSRTCQPQRRRQGPTGWKIEISTPADRIRATSSPENPNEPAPSMMQRTRTPSCALMQTASTKRRPFASLFQMYVSMRISLRASAMASSMAG